MARSRYAGSVVMARLLAALLVCGAARGGDVMGPAVPGIAPVADVAPADERVSALGASTSETEARPLGAPREREEIGEKSAAAPSASSGLRTAGALAAVLSLIFALRWVFVRAARARGGLVGKLGAGGRAPSGLLEVLGRYPVARGQTLVLLRVDRRVLLLSQSSSGFSTLAEMRDTDDVASILGKAMDEEGSSMTSRFQNLLKGLERDPAMVEGVETVEVAPSGGRFSRRIGRDFAPAEQTSAVDSVRRRLSALRGDAA